MTDASGYDARVLALPVDKLCKSCRHVNSYRDLPRDLIDRIAHLFEHDKDPDEGKWVRVDGRGGVDEAKQEILDRVRLYQDAPEKADF